jgi:hypothetical protein
LADTRIELPAIEYSLTEHCNLTCLHCDKAAPLLPKKMASLAEFVRDLEVLAGVLHARELRISGGEPTLHPQLLSFLHEGRSIGVADLINVFTNGTRLHYMPNAFLEAIDILSVSIYPSIRLRMPRSKIEVICREKGIQLSLRNQEHFWLTLLNQPIEDPTKVREVFRVCESAHDWSCHVVHEGRFYKCSVAPYHEPRIAALGIMVENREVDGVQLHDNPTLREDLERYLADDRPLAACKWCLGSRGPKLEHRLLNRAGRAEWLAADHRAIIAAWRPPQFEDSTRQLEDSTAAYRDTIRQLEDSGAAYRDTISQLERTLEETQQLITSLYASRSWRVTWPLRQIDAGIRKLRYLMVASAQRIYDQCR